MAQPVQTRSRKTRAALVQAAATLVQAQGYESLRIDEVVAGAGVAKGTYFAHFTDKDGILAELIGEEMTHRLEQMARAPAPSTPGEMAQAMEPVIGFLATERTVFDIVMRYSGGMGPAGNPVIADGITRQVEILANWIGAAAQAGLMRADKDPALLAEGVQAFVAQVVALHFCTDLGSRRPPSQEIVPFLDAWLGVR